jgi:hypothetical protein
VAGQGARLHLATAQREAAPVLVEHLRHMVAALPATLGGARDRALLLVGFMGVAFTPSGLEVTLRRSKTDQEGRGRLVALPHSGTPDLFPARALRAWLNAAAVVDGPVFSARSPAMARSALGECPGGCGGGSGLRRAKEARRPRVARPRASHQPVKAAH